MNNAPPELNDPKAERALVGSVLLDAAAYRRVQHVTPEAYTSWKLTTVWKAIQRMDSKGVQLDYVTLCNELNGELADLGGGAYLSSLVTAVPSSLHVEEYAKIVTDYAQRRADVRLAEKLASLAMKGGEAYAGSRADVGHAILRGGPGANGMVSAWEASEKVLEEIEYYVANPVTSGPRDLSTGMVDLDRITGGLHQGLYAVAGTTSAGKTALALSIATGVALAGKRVAFFSPEMSPEDLIHRLVCAHAQVDSRRIEAGDLTQAELARIHEVFGWLSELHLVISNEATMQGIEAKVHRALPLDLIILDGMGLITGASSEKMYQQRGELSLWAKSISDNENIQCPVWMNLQVALKEVKNRGDKRPRLGDIYGSSEPEMWTDNLLYIYREDAYEDNPRDHTHLLDVTYWKCRKRRRMIPATVQLILDRNGMVRTASTQREPEGLPDWMD